MNNNKNKKKLKNTISDSNYNNQKEVCNNEAENKYKEGSIIDNKEKDCNSTHLSHKDTDNTFERNNLITLSDKNNLYKKPEEKFPIGKTIDHPEVVIAVDNASPVDTGLELDDELASFSSPLDTPGVGSMVEKEAIMARIASDHAKKRKELLALIAALSFCAAFMTVEIVGGYIAHSLAILTDAAHLFTDVGSYSLSIFAIKASSRMACDRYSFGWHRAEVVGTLMSVFTIWALVGAITVEAINRIIDMRICATQPNNPHIICKPVDSKMLIFLGALGLMVNFGCALILRFGGSHGHSHHHGHGHASAAVVNHNILPSDLDFLDENEKHGERSNLLDNDHNNKSYSHTHGGYGGSNDVADHGHSHGGNGDHSQYGHEHNEAGSISDFLHDDGGKEGGHNHDNDTGYAINAAMIHALGDSVQSVGVILAGVFMYYMNTRVYGTPNNAFSLYNLSDPVSSIFFAVVTLYMTKNLIGELLSILMEGTPVHVDPEKIRKSLMKIPNVVGVHDLHVWAIAAGKITLSVHIVSDDHKQSLIYAQRILDKKYKIHHHAIQVDAVSIGKNCEYLSTLRHVGNEQAGGISATQNQA